MFLVCLSLCTRALCLQSPKPAGWSCMQGSWERPKTKMVAASCLRYHELSLSAESFPYKLATLILTTLVPTTVYLSCLKLVEG